MLIVILLGVLVAYLIAGLFGPLGDLIVSNVIFTICLLKTREDEQRAIALNDQCMPKSALSNAAFIGFFLSLVMAGVSLLRYLHLDWLLG